ncbi:MAG: SIMPL domain-containing protein [Balneola sp.]
MEKEQVKSFGILGAAIIVGLAIFGFLLGNSVIQFKEYERTVTVKGLAEQEHIADIVIWPIQFTEASNTLENIYVSLEKSADKITEFLESNGVESSEISFAIPQVTDKLAQQYGNGDQNGFRYVANQVVTVYSNDVEKVRKVMNKVGDLGKQGVALSGQSYQFQTEYLFTRLNEIKPDMIEQATKEARAVAEKFAEDSNSKLGKIKTAYQGQFSISSRDQNNPHIKNIRVVSTVVYYLSD